VNASPGKVSTVPEMEPLQKQRSFSTPIYVKKEGNGPAFANQGFSTASQDSRHVHGKSGLCPPTSPYLASAKPILKMDCAS